MVILASSSPRRKELLKKIFPEFGIIAPNIDERALVLPAYELPAAESKAKAKAVASSHPDDEIIACDTIVVLDGEVLGKPKDEEGAVKMLLKEQGKEQTVLSGWTYLGKGKEITRTVATKVFFQPLTEAQIREYVQAKKPLDKAGAYGIQDGYPLIAKIEGSFDNVMGLPTEDIAAALNLPLRR